MFPILLQVGPVTLRSLAVVVFVSFFLSGWVFWRKGREEHYPEEDLFDVFLLSLGVGLGVSRLAFVVFHWPLFGLQLERWVNMLGYPGVMPIFGLMASAWTVYTLSLRHKWDAFEVLDFWAMAMAFAFMLGWFGLFLDGTGFGYSTDWFWGMTFPGVFDKHHPTQLVGFVLYLLLFVSLAWAEERYRTFAWYRNTRQSAQTGFLFCIFWIVTGLIGGLLAFFMPSQLVVFGVGLDMPLRFLLCVYGGTLLFVRAGRSFYAIA